MIPQRIADFIADRGDGTAVEYIHDRRHFLVWKPGQPTSQPVDEHVAGVRHVYTSGNWSCDCNRRDDIRRAGGEVEDVEDPLDPDDECGDSISIGWLVEVIGGEAHVVMVPAMLGLMAHRSGVDA